MVVLARRSSCASPSREDAVLQAGGLTAEPSALVAGCTAAVQRGARGWERSDQQAAQRGWKDTRRDGKKSKGGEKREEMSRSCTKGKREQMEAMVGGKSKRINVSQTAIHLQ